MTEQEFLKKVTELRRLKRESSLLLTRGSGEWHTKEFKQDVQSFRKQIPSKNADLKWVYETSDFSDKYAELQGEFTRLRQWNDQLHESWITREANREMRAASKRVSFSDDTSMKKETEIKEEKKPQNSVLKKNAEIKKDLKKETKTKKQGQIKMSLRGGRRDGSGRKSIGIKKTVAINLPQKIWDEIDNLIQNGEHDGYGPFFRSLVHDKFPDWR